ncbi:MAG TPA: PQQ-dependent sugar dehydrogenase, partial [Anaerolineaceae bacterium]
AATPTVFQAGGSSAAQPSPVGATRVPPMGETPTPNQTAVLSLPIVSNSGATQPPPVGATSIPSTGETPAPNPTTILSLPVISNSAATPTPVSVRQLPDPGTAQWNQVAAGLAGPVGIANAGDGSGRLFILLRSGTIQVLKAGQVLNTPFLDITNRVNSSGSEQGLLGIAFHPQYQQNGFFYINYTDLNGDTVIARYHVSGSADQADPSSEQVVLRVQQPYPNHNGGSLVFGPDGYLYLGLGDGGSQGDPQNNGQSTQTLLGKLLRIDVDHGSPYTIPADNPFAKGGGRPEIWAYGLRNPWRFSFDALTHDLYIGDVGQDTYEEIDFLPAGAPGGTNFGWRFREGMHPYNGQPPAGVILTDPVFEYTHAQGGCSITGGFVYRGQALLAWQGVYLFGDYCSGLVWGLVRQADGVWNGQVLFQTGSAITSFGVDEQDEIYLADQRGGIYQLAPR